MDNGHDVRGSGGVVLDAGKMSSAPLNWMGEDIIFGYKEEQAPTHVAFTRCNVDGQWSNPAVIPIEDVMTLLGPYALALHYGLFVFEGQDIVTDDRGHPNMWRPHKNWQRKFGGAKELGMRMCPYGHHMRTISMAIHANQHLIPPKGANARDYVRTLLIGDQPGLGLTTSGTSLLIVLVSAVGEYFDGPISLQFSKLPRTQRMGHVKMPAHYVPWLLKVMRLRAEGYDGFVFPRLDGEHPAEMQAGNLFGIYEDAGSDLLLVTAPSKGFFLGVEVHEVLEGVMRDTVCHVAADMSGVRVLVENRATMDQLFTDSLGFFSTGTAARVAFGRKFRNTRGQIREFNPNHWLPRALFEKVVGMRKEPWEHTEYTEDKKDGEGHRWLWPVE